MSLFSGDNSFLGIDIGSSGVKLVELKKQNGKLRLSTYGFTEKISPERSELFKDTASVAKIINRIRKEAGITSRNAAAALPTFSVFSSVISLSNIAKKEMAAAVSWEAKKVIPLPLEEVVLDWKVINGDNKKVDAGETKVLLTGAPKTLVKKYIDIFKEAQINLFSLETETFSLIRALVGNDKSACMIAEIGTSTTDISIINGGIPLLSRSIDVGGAVITQAISNNLGIGLERAEQFKYDLGIASQNSASNEIIPKTIINSIDPIINEIKYMLNLFKDKNGKSVEKIILSGGSSLLPNFVDYLEKVLNMEVIIGDAWARVSCPVELKPMLSEIGPKMSVAIGLAMRGAE